MDSDNTFRRSHRDDFVRSAFPRRNHWTILSPIQVGAIAAIATIGTIQFENSTASISSGQLTDVGTVGTIISGFVTVQ